MPREKAVPETDATSCRRTAGSSRYPFVIRAVDLFKNMGKFVVPKGSPSDTKEWEEGAPRTCYANAGQSRIQEKQGQIGAQRGVPRVSLLPSLLPFILSFTPSAPANLKQQVPTPLLRGSRSPSGFLLPLPMYGARCTLGARFSLLEKSKGFCCRATVYIPAPESVFRERILSKEIRYTDSRIHEFHTL